MIIFAGGMTPHLRTWLYQTCQFLLAESNIPTTSKVCTSANDLDNYLALTQASAPTLLLDYRQWGNLSQQYLAQPQNRHLFLHHDPLTLTAWELSQGKTAFSHILLELWLTQGQADWQTQPQTYLIDFSQLLARPKPTLRKIAAFLGIAPGETTFKDLLFRYPLPTPDPANPTKGFSSLAPAYPSSDSLTPEQRLLLTIFLRPSREIWFGPDTDRYDRQLNQRFSTVATEAWQKTFQTITDLVNEHLSDRLGDWLKTAYDHGVKVLQTQNPTGAAQLLTLLAEQLRQRENQQEAKILYQEVLQLHPQDIKAAFVLGQLAEQEENIPEAIGYYQQVIQQDPHHSKALFRLAYLNKIQENFTQAEDYLLEILQKDPNHQIAQYWLIKVLESQGQLDRAKTWVKENDIEFLQKLPDYLSHTGGNAYDEANYDLAKSCYHLALELEPNRYQNWFDLALVASKEKKRTEAIRYYQKVLAINPDHDETMVNLGALLIHQGKFTEAIALLEQALKRDEQNSMAYHNLAICYVYQGQLAEAAFYANQAVQNKPEDPGYHSHLLTILSAMTEIRSEDLAQVSRVWYDNHVVAKALPQITHYANSLDGDRPLRVGFVSGDFKRHSVSYFVKPIFEHHHPEQIEIYAYAQVEEPDDLTDTLKTFCDHWRDTVNLEDQEMANQIQQDQIDILVDLSGHTLFNRLSVFGMKPAPIQATYLGYPATTGLPTVDYWITDTQLHPKDTQERAVEEIWRLPRCYISYDPPNPSPPIGPLPQTQLGVITFGSFNASRKLTSQTLKIWSEILKQVPRSRLLLKCSDPRYSPQLMIESFMKLGIDRERLIVYRNSPYQDHLNLYNQVDLHLDPMPYTGCTTTCEALWMGVPTLTLAGQKKMERMSTSILAHTGLENFIAQTPEDYIAKAVEFVTHPEYLALLRQTLRDRLKTSQLLDGIGLTHALETAFRQMWHRYLTTQDL